MRRHYLQHQSTLLPQLGNLLPGGLGILLPLSGADFGLAFLSAGSGADGSAMPVADIRVVIPGTLETLGVSTVLVSDLGLREGVVIDQVTRTW